MQYDNLDEIEAAGLTLWKVALVKCRMCGHEFVAVYPANVLDEDCMQCSNCEHMTCEPRDIDEVA